MKKTIALLVAASAVAFAANASAKEYTPYVGVNYNYTEMRDDFDFNSYSVTVGTDYNKYFGTELFYQNSNKDHKLIDGDKEKRDFDAYGLDVYGYLPLGCAQKFAPFVTAGIANYDFDYADNAEKVSDNGLGYRLGAGVQYKFDNNIAIRALGRYVWTDKRTRSFIRILSRSKIQLLV